METTLKEFTLAEILPDPPFSNQYDFTGTYTDTEGVTHNVKVFDTSYFVNMAAFHYGERKIMLPYNLMTARTHFGLLFDKWKESRAALYLKQAYAYTLAYNPIENYSSREDLVNDITLHAKGTSTTRTNNTLDTRLPNISNTESFDNYKEKDDFHNNDVVTDTSKVVTTPTDTTTEEKMAFNSSAFSGDRKTSRGGSITEEHNPTEVGEDPGNVRTDHGGHIEHTTTGTRTNTETGSDITSHSGTITDTNAGVDTDTHNYTLTKRGNIGTMTPADMLAREFAGLSQDLAFRALSEFVDRFTYYNESIEGWW